MPSSSPRKPKPPVRIPKMDLEVELDSLDIFISSPSQYNCADQIPFLCLFLFCVSLIALIEVQGWGRYSLS